VSWTRIIAIVRKELRDYRRNGAVVATMSILPLIFVIAPLLEVFELPAASAHTLLHREPLLYMLGIPTLVPAALAAAAIVGERQQGTLEPVLTTPIRREELLIGKALAVLAPALVIAYAVFAVSIASIELFAQAPVASAVVRGPVVLDQVLFTPLLAAWSIWVGIAVSTRVHDVRAAQQFSILASLPTVAITTLVSYGVIRATHGLAVGFAAALIAVDCLGWRVVARMFDRERLITGTRS
jgi:ABC-2 type transport system permease protein